MSTALAGTAMPPLDTAAIDWVSEDPHLSGNFAPIGPEIDAADLPVTAGRIPPDLRGAHMRNGPNPRFKPIAYAYPMDGDGMVHAVFFEGGRARYRNRYVRTRGLAAERRAGRALYGSLFHPVPVDPALLGEDGEPGPIKTGAFINVLQHGGHLIAFGEAQPAYEMTMELDTIGEWTAGTGEVVEMGAHNRRHPVTGDLYAIAYSALEPVVRVHRIDAAGTLRDSFPVPLAAPSMIHDFVLTERHLVLLIGPAVFDMEAAGKGGSFLQWRPSLGTRIGLVPLDGGAVTWLEAEPFFVFHFANGFERGRRIVLDYVRHDGLHVGPSSGPVPPPMLHRMVIDPAARSLREERLADFVTEFPRINDARTARESRFIYLPTRTGTLAMERPPSSTFNAVVKVDAETGATRQHDAGNRVLGEPVFIPRAASGAEDDGYLITYAYDPSTGTSDLLLLDAARIEEAPVAVIRMPQRVPQGLHGNWMPG
ncbi:carotenoid oxygenase family protein [Roseomonas populi]|uniref:Dioxygenase n=1 Tax=Roseomonas populi TaxID=3121582 RepID=A0ABT1X2S9_9PROT|nr:carotenoid oxygenase family protein [Roseomonas pecuniae]MCR0981482.1 carotenoid oxygenase family protein [Roseomonas pecuniae]